MDQERSTNFSHGKGGEHALTGALQTMQTLTVFALLVHIIAFVPAETVPVCPEH